MLNLPLPEIIAFTSALLIYFAASILAALQLSCGKNIYNSLLYPLVSLALALDTLTLILRSLELKAVPLTGLFESLTLLTVIFGLVYLLSGLSIQQVWFGSVMIWTILAMNLFAAVVAEPAAEPQPIAQTLWAIVHAVAMLLGVTSVTFATAAASIFLIGKRKLKKKLVFSVLGKVPNLQRLERLNLLAIKFAVVFIAFGIISGLAIAFTLDEAFLLWIADAKVITTIAVLLILVMILFLNDVFLLRGGTREYITIVAFALVLFAILGVTILGLTQHRFS